MDKMCLKLFYPLVVLLLHMSPLAFVSGLGRGDTNIRCIEKERQALLAVKQGLVGNHSLSSWGGNATTDCCEWEGVYCSEQTGHVTELDLSTPQQSYLPLQENRITGMIPEWIGISFSKLAILILRSNQFSGSMPLELCHLKDIQLLDLSRNCLSGTIPQCLNNLTTLAQKGSSSPSITHDRRFYDMAISSLAAFEDDASLIWKGRMSEYKSTLGLVKSIDFSSNRLDGEIPRQITDLIGLVSLNLSRNYLTGQMPPQIGKLQSLDFLDLSRNHIYGRIPTSLSQIYGLGVLDLSNNNLSGKIPIGTQLQSFDPSTYAENPQLCGLPLQKTCPTGETGSKQVPKEEEDELISFGFYVSMGLGFAVGFWGVCGSLIFNRSWRYTYFRFLNVLTDWFYVRTMLIRRQRML